MGAKKAKPEAEKILKGWSTKFALTKGIQPVRVRLYGGYVYTLGGPSVIETQLKPGRTFFEDLEDAKRNASAQAKRKLKSLQLQQVKLGDLIQEPFVAGEELK